VLGRVIQNRGNDPALIFRRNRSIASVAKGKREHIFSYSNQKSAGKDLSPTSALIVALASSTKK
jgi:hypothetical protein